MTKQLDHANPIPDTRVFDLRQSRRGYRINNMLNSLTTPENRAAFTADEEGYMAKFGLTEEEKELIRRRDFSGLIDAGANVYFLLKLGAVTGIGLYKMGAQMRGERYEEFLSTRKVAGAV